MGLSDIVILGLLAHFAWKLLRSRAPAPAPTYAGIGPDGGHHALARSFDPAPRDLDTVRRSDPSFDNAAVAKTATELFIRVQGAWTARDVRPIGALLTPGMQAELQRDCEQMKAKGRVNRLDDIAVRTADVVEGWNEQGQDYVTVRIEAHVLDYTTDEKTGQVVEGNASEPVTFEEFWTFTRPQWAKTWRLSAIRQPVQAAH
jgi:predicted lipid-binding transport protein (Tim44 family)